MSIQIRESTLDDLEHVNAVCDANARTCWTREMIWYTDFSTTITVESIEVTGTEASVHFKELTEEHQASVANGPSNVPSGYSLPQTATPAKLNTFVAVRGGRGPAAAS
ncbi:hypothetical protein [Arthrobacter sp. U41]|uniref:hypothetical protein n=1 Tax=Arthrobacter sp. U41 TaxID=1849032 RepID=UPI0008593D21|nr:hypothetical protein [Arthrobacter sp. U41]AOT03141.1 hypothetical protein ASPU41_07095 [Arthrobacter sp. U41]